MTPRAGNGAGIASIIPGDGSFDSKNALICISSAFYINNHIYAVSRSAAQHLVYESEKVAICNYL